MWVIWSATPAWLMALTESPPPMMEMAVLVGGDSFGDGVGADSKARKLEDAGGAVPYDGLGRGDHVLDGGDRLGADVESLPVGGEIN